MTLPASWNTVRVFATYKRFSDGSAAQGSVTFDPLIIVTLPEGSGRTIVMPEPRTVALDVDGKIDIQLPATDDPDAAPAGLVYKVTERIAPSNRIYYIEVALSGGDVDLATVVPLVPLDPMAAYLRTSDVGVLVEGKQTAATQAEAEAGTETAIRSFSPLRVAQAIAALGGGGGAALSDDPALALGATASAGVGTQASRDDHVHPYPTAAQVGADAAGAAATAETNAKAYADGLVVGLLDDRGNYNASGNVFPSSGGSGASGAILKGDLWTINVAGSLGGVAVGPGDVVRALVDAPGSTASNWAITENNFGYVAEPAQSPATQPEAEAGTETAIRSWSPLRIWQAIAAKLSLGTWISGATGKTTPVNADSIPLSDSAASGGLKKLTLTNLLAFVKAYFDPIYAAVTHSHALSALTQSGATTGQVAQWNGTAWVPATAGGGGSPGGSDKQLQFNNAGAFGGCAVAYWDAVNGRLSVGAGTSPAAKMHAKAGSASEIPMIAQGTTSQTGNLQEWRDSSGTTLAMIMASGACNFGMTASGPQVWVGGASYHGSISLRGDPAAMGQYGIGYDSGTDATFLYGYTTRKFVLGMRDFDGTYRYRFKFDDSDKSWAHFAGVNYVFDTTTGTKLGTAASQKLGFWGATAVVQPASANQATVAGTAGGTYTSTEQTLISDLKTLVNQLRADLVTVGIIKGAA